MLVSARSFYSHLPEYHKQPNLISNVLHTFSIYTWILTKWYTRYLERNSSNNVTTTLRPRYRCHTFYGHSRRRHSVGVPHALPAAVGLLRRPRLPPHHRRPSEPADPHTDWPVFIFEIFWAVRFNFFDFEYVSDFFCYFKNYFLEQRLRNVTDVFR